MPGKRLCFCHPNHAANDYNAFGRKKQQQLKNDAFCTWFRSGANRNFAPKTANGKRNTPGQKCKEIFPLGNITIFVHKTAENAALFGGNTLMKI